MEMRKSASEDKSKRVSNRKPTVGTAPQSTFFIVGIGASAGGLEALEQFLGNVPAKSGLAYVIVQHLDPDRKGILAEILQRKTQMRVFRVKDRTKVQPDCVYVIPPNKEMSILHGVLHLFDLVEPRWMRLPIDNFFRFLAQDRKERCIGIILSGMGSDGALGLKAIKENGGLVAVQEPASARFDGMPRSAVNTGLADLVAPVEQLPMKIIDFLHHALAVPQSAAPLGETDRSDLEKIILLLRDHCGHDFSQYKTSLLKRRIERRMGIHLIDKTSNYIQLLRLNPAELSLLFKELLVGVSSFFRDTAAWEQLAEKALPALLDNYPQGQDLRAWVSGCSTGEEAYSLAMVFKEALERRSAGGGVSSRCRSSPPTRTRMRSPRPVAVNTRRRS